MTHKVTIELNEDAVVKIRAICDPGLPRGMNNGFILHPDTVEEIYKQLPKPQKKWKFYKGNFPSQRELDGGYYPTVRSKGDAVIVIGGNAPDRPDAYCFDQFQIHQFAKAVVDWCQSHPIRIPLSAMVEQFLSQQEEK